MASSLEPHRLGRPWATDETNIWTAPSWVRMPRPFDLEPMEWRSRIATVEHLREWAVWHWFLTLGFRADVSDARAEQALRWFLGQLARDVVGRHVQFARTLDRHADGRLHFHVLVAFPEHPWAAPPDPAWAVHLWCRAAPRDLGTGLPHLTRAEWFDRARDGVAYVFLRHAGQAWNRACPRTGPCKRRPCVVAGTGWR